MKRGEARRNTNDIDLYSHVMKLKSANKFLYNKQIEEINKQHEIKPYIKWENEFGEDINWNNILEIPFKCLIDTKLRTFQYKYIMRIIPNNKFLYKCNITNTSLCDFCCMNVETNKHMFWECTIIRAFWTDIENYLSSKDIHVLLNYSIISFGITETSSMYKILNSIFIIEKYFIFKNKYAKTIPNFVHFISCLKYIENIEKLIANFKNKTTQHEAKHIHLRTLETHHL